MNLYAAEAGTDEGRRVRWAAWALAIVWILVFAGIVIFLTGGTEPWRWPDWIKVAGPYLLSNHPGFLPTRLLTYSFIHASTIQLVFNLFYWWAFIRVASPLLTVRGFLRLYSLGTIAAGWLNYELACAATPEFATAGATWTAFTFLGYIAFRIRTPVRLWGENRSVRKGIAVLWLAAGFFSNSSEIARAPSLFFYPLVDFVGLIALNCRPIQPRTYWLLVTIGLPLADIYWHKLWGFHPIPKALAVHIVANIIPSALGFIYGATENWTTRYKVEWEARA